MSKSQLEKCASGDRAGCVLTGVICRMRNPLNAILHCAAELIELLTQLSAIPTDERMTVLDDCLEASRTIVYCKLLAEMQC